MSAAPETPGAPPRDNLRGAAWLLADMALNIWALVIVKAMGADMPAVQIVFLRALVGLVLLAPLIWRAGGWPRFGQPGLHAARVGFSTLALATSFHAVAHLPLALFTAVNFTRPLMLMAMAALVLRERISARQWLAGAVGLAGVAIAVRPDQFGGNASGLLALLVTVVAGTAAVIVTRRMRAEPTLNLMVSYTAGLALLTAGPALLFWQPLTPQGWGAMLLVGLFAQTAQFCFLRAQFWGDAGVLAPLGYASLVLSVGMGLAVFGEVPTPGFWLGAALILLAARQGAK